MRDTLLQHKDYYTQHFSGFIDYERAKEVICLGIEDIFGSDKVVNDVFLKDDDGTPIYYADRSHWFFTPGCAQIAADTFFSPVSVYPQRSNPNALSATYFPLLETNESAKIKKKLSSPLILQFVNNCHWITLSLKRSRKISYPLPDNMYDYACNSMKRNTNIKSTAWNHYLTFLPRQKSDQGNIYEQSIFSVILLYILLIRL